MQKTTIITNNGETGIVKIGENNVEMVKSTIYLGSTIGTGDTSKNEIERRISLGWRKYWSLGRIFKGPYSNRAKGMVFNANVVPVVTYGAQTWTSSKNLENKIRITQNAMKRSMLN